MAEYSDNNSANKIPLIAVVGPTASGKTDFALDIAEKFGGEIISLDSMQVYKYLNIGTAKPTRSEMRGIPHHMLDCIDPREPFSASDYAREASKIISDIYSRGKLPIVCGGTGLYLNSLLYSYNMSEASYDNSVREALYNDANEKGAEYIYARLKEVDPVSAAEIHPNNIKRVVRALEIYMLTGKPKSEQITSNDESVFDVLIFGMDWDRQTLYERINKRVDIMLEKGLVAEVEALVKHGILKLNDDTSQAGQAIGYKEILAYLSGKCSYDDAVEAIKLNTRHYAKRQITWFKKVQGILWLDPHEQSAAEEAYNNIKNFLERHGENNGY